MSSTAYLERIGFDGSVDGSEAMLDRLIALHQETVPFENIDIVRLNRSITMDRDRFRDKIVDERRGGFCYELNGAFSLLLELLGATISYGYGRWPMRDGSWAEPYDHVILAVAMPGISDPVLVDVGFGADSPTTAIPLRSGAEKGRYRASTLDRASDLWRIEQRTSEGDWALIYEVDFTPRALSEFSARCEFLQTAPSSHFTQQLLCSRAAPGGRLTIGGGRFIQTVDGNRTERDIEGLDDELELLASWFDIQLDPATYGGIQ